MDYVQYPIKSKHKITINGLRLIPVIDHVKSLTKTIHKTYEMYT